MDISSIIKFFRVIFLVFFLFPGACKSKKEEPKEEKSSSAAVSSAEKDKSPINIQVDQKSQSMEAKQTQPSTPSGQIPPENQSQFMSKPADNPPPVPAASNISRTKDSAVPSSPPGTQAAKALSVNPELTPDTGVPPDILAQFPGLPPPPPMLPPGVTPEKYDEYIKKIEREKPIKAFLENVFVMIGGDTGLARLQTYYYDSEGTIMGIPFKARTSWMAPDTLRVEMDNGLTYMRYKNKTTVMVGPVILDPLEATDQHFKMFLKVRNLSTLMPLKNMAVIAKMEENIVFQKKNTVKFEIKENELEASVYMYFDKETNFLSGIEYKMLVLKKDELDPLMYFTAEQKHDYISVIQQFDNYRFFNGGILPGITRLIINGTVVQEENITNAYFGVIDTTKLFPPVQAKAFTFFLREMPQLMVAYMKPDKNPLDGEGDKELNKLVEWIKNRNYMIITQPFVTNFLTRELHSPLGTPIYTIEASSAGNPEKYQISEVAIPVFKQGLMTEFSDGNKGVKKIFSETMACINIFMKDNKSSDIPVIYESLEKVIKKSNFEITGKMTAFSFDYAFPKDSPYPGSPEFIKRYISNGFVLGCFPVKVRKP
jgi:hypothetical protein